MTAALQIPDTETRMDLSPGRELCISSTFPHFFCLFEKKFNKHFPPCSTTLHIQRHVIFSLWWPNKAAGDSGKALELWLLGAKRLL